MRGRRPSQANIVNLDCIAWEAGNDEISWVLTYARRLGRTALLLDLSRAARRGSRYAVPTRKDDTFFSSFFFSLFCISYIPIWRRRAAPRRAAPSARAFASGTRNVLRLSSLVRETHWIVSRCDTYSRRKFDWNTRQRLNFIAQRSATPRAHREKLENTLLRGKNYAGRN